MVEVHVHYTHVYVHVTVSELDVKIPFYLSHNTSVDSRYEHVPVGFWHTFITKKVNTTERSVCSGDQDPLKIACVPFHELFHGANSGTCSHTGKTGSERQKELT